MKNFFVYILIISVFFLNPNRVDAQLVSRAERLIQSAFSIGDSDTLSGNGNIGLEERYKRDSVRLNEALMQIQEMKLNELTLRSQLDEAQNNQHITDSAKRAAQLQRIDSLRKNTPGVPVIFDEDTLFRLYAARGGYSAFDRAEMIGDILKKIGKDKSKARDSVRTLDNDGRVDIMYGDRVIVSITDQDALWEGTTRYALAERYKPILSKQISELKSSYNLIEIGKRVALFILVLIVQYILFKFTNYLFRKLRRKIISFKNRYLKPIIIRDYELVNTRRLGRILIFFNNILRYFVLFLQLIISVPILFAIFPQTEKLALTIFKYIMEPIKMVFRSIVEYIPNLFIILVIWYCIKYIIKGLHYITNEIQNEKLKIAGFYSDWAQPTFNIIRFLLYAFMVAMIYPYLPGSQSGVFQGISVFVGIIISLGSSTVIGNIIAGLVITYMRPFKLGDRIKLNDTTGNVIEKTPFVTRLRTPKNEVVTIPNAFIMSSHTVNYSASARQFGLIIHTTVTIGYDVPWRLVHQLLIDAARSTPGVIAHPKPFVLETELQDNYPCYQINAYIKNADAQAQIMSDLHQNIQDTFNEAGVEILSPSYISTRDGNESTIPTDPMK